MRDMWAWTLVFFGRVCFDPGRGRVYHRGTMNGPPPLPPYLRAVEVDTEPGLGALALRQENAALRSENGRLRSQRDEARLERDELRSLSDPSGHPPPTRRQARVMVGAAGAGAGLFLVARVILRFIADQWPETAPLVDAVMPFLGG